MVARVSPQLEMVYVLILSYMDVSVIVVFVACKS